MKRILLSSIILLILTLVFLTSCATATSNMHTEVNVNVGNQPIVAEDQVTTTISGTGQEQPSDDESTRTWFNVLIFVIGIPLSVLGLISLYIFIREIRKRKYSVIP